MLDKKETKVYLYDEENKKYFIMRDDENDENLAVPIELKTIDQMRAFLEIGAAMEYLPKRNVFLVSLNGMAQLVVDMASLNTEGEEIVFDDLPFIVMEAVAEQLASAGYSAENLGIETFFSPLYLNSSPFKARFNAASIEF